MTSVGANSCTSITVHGPIGSRRSQVKVGGRSARLLAAPPQRGGVRDVASRSGAGRDGVLSKPQFLRIPRSAWHLATMGPAGAS